MLWTFGVDSHQDEFGAHFKRLCLIDVMKNVKKQSRDKSNVWTRKAWILDAAAVRITNIKI